MKLAVLDTHNILAHITDPAAIELIKQRHWTSPTKSSLRRAIQRLLLRKFINGIKRSRAQV